MQRNGPIPKKSAQQQQRRGKGLAHLMRMMEQIFLATTTIARNMTGFCVLCNGNGVDC